MNIQEAIEKGYAIHCETEDESEKVVKCAVDNNYKWCNKQSSNWFVRKGDTCYFLDKDKTKLCYDDINCRKINDFTGVIKFKDLTFEENKKEIKLRLKYEDKIWKDASPLLTCAIIPLNVGGSPDLDNVSYHECEPSQLTVAGNEILSLRPERYKVAQKEQEETKKELSNYQKKLIWNKELVALNIFYASVKLNEDGYICDICYHLREPIIDITDSSNIIVSFKVDDQDVKYESEPWNGGSIYYNIQRGEEERKIVETAAKATCPSNNSDMVDYVRAIRAKKDKLKNDAETYKEVWNCNDGAVNQDNTTPDYYYNDGEYNPLIVCEKWNVSPWIAHAIPYLRRAGKKQYPDMSMIESEIEDNKKAINCIVERNKLLEELIGMEGE